MPFLDLMHNDFEKFVFPKHPELEIVKQELKAFGINALMSGSGSTVYGVTRNSILAKEVYYALKDKYDFVRLCESLCDFC